MPPRKAGVGGNLRPERPAQAAEAPKGEAQAEHPEGVAAAAAGLAGSAAHPRLFGRGQQETRLRSSLRQPVPPGSGLRHAIVTVRPRPKGSAARERAVERGRATIRARRKMIVAALCSGSKPALLSSHGHRSASILLGMREAGICRLVHAELIPPAYVRPDNLRELADMTQQRYLGMDSHRDEMLRDSEHHTGADGPGTGETA